MIYAKDRGYGPEFTVETTFGNYSLMILRENWTMQD